jgi:GT2 family glycosyltransferase
MNQSHNDPGMNAQKPLTLIVGIATAGRRDVLRNTLKQLACQQTLPDRVIVCPAGEDDFDLSIIPKLPYSIEVVKGARGLTAQRNLILDHASATDLIIFFDDDFYPAPDFIARTIECFSSFPDVVAITGRVIEDGAKGPGIDHSTAVKILAENNPVPHSPITPVYNTYGCNMAFRMASILKAGIKFDENLPLYSWLEDIDFSRALSSTGKIAHNSALRGVHLATKRGRTSGIRFGYSQVANPLYLAKKGTFGWGRALRQISRNAGANLLHLLHPEPWIDRRGRLKGNLIAVAHLFCRKLDPRRILDMD